MAVRRIARESQQTEYKSSWQDEYLEWICGYANSRGGKLYVGVNDDGYVVGLADTRFLLDELPNKAASLMGVMLDVDHFAADGRGENIKHAVVPADVARKPANLYARGVLTPEAVADIDAAPDDVSRATPRRHRPVRRGAGPRQAAQGERGLPPQAGKRPRYVAEGKPRPRRP